MVTYREREYTIHDSCVNRQALRLVAERYQVKADIYGYDTPEIINGYIPDIQATNNNKTIIIEVEGKDSINEDKKQIDTFKKYAQYNYNTTFELYLAINKTKCLLRGTW